MTTHLVCLAAGQGTRMVSDRPKVLHEVAGLPLFAHALRSAAPVADGRRVLVVGHGGEEVVAAARALDPQIEIAEQAERLGTGHAVGCAAPLLAEADGDTLVLYGDTPFIQATTLGRMQAARAGGADIVVLGFDAAEPGRYGRLVTGPGGMLERIVEHKDASDEERAITLCNSGVILARTELLFELVGALGNANAAGEYYLTDIVAAARARGLSAAAVICEEAETLGVNSRADLAAAEAAFQARARAAALAGGATLRSPDTVFFSHDTHLEPDVEVEPHVVFGPGVTVRRGARIGAYSHIEGAEIGPGAQVGPFARLRPGARLDKAARVGNFVEVKNASLGAGAKANHLSYLGDAAVGAGANIGAGTITCNYDGVFKHRTEIGARAFIGSDTMLVAPVRVGEDAMTATGAVITENVPDGALAVARARQVNKPGLARRLMAKLKAARARRQEG